LDEKINSTDDKRVENNPPQVGVLPGDPMRLKYRILSEAEKKTMGDLKITFQALFSTLESFGGSRELSIAKTKLEESCMWAVKHLTA
jgi:hypothetical protein